MTGAQAEDGELGGWPLGAATGVGSLPGTVPLEAARLVLGELPDLPHLPELPARGPGADLLGRGAALLAGLAVDLQPAGWRLVARPGVDQRRALDMLAQDLDALEEAAQGYSGPLKVQAPGPWTLAAGLELPRGDRSLRDPSAVRDLTEALAEGLAAHLADLHRRLPGARLLLQLDEPALPVVLAGRVPTASGFGTLPAVDEPRLVDRLRAVLAVATVVGAVPIVHSCAPGLPLALLASAGAGAVSLDAVLLSPRQDDQIGELVEAGVGLLLGLVPATDSELPSVAETVRPARALWHRLGFPASRLAAAAVVTPSCGLAAASPPYARLALERCREAGRALVEAPEQAAERGPDGAAQ